VNNHRQYAATIISVMVVSGFFGVLFLWLTRPIPNMSEGALTALNILLGSLGAAFVQVISYWIGSSAGSRQKDAVIAETTSTAAAKP
jgi:uncharacterized membrane protein YeaQ/YmgE (transglycosylase-associated protein family)